MAEQANHPNNRETLVRFAAIWLSLAADELTEASCHHSDGPLPLYPESRHVRCNSACPLSARSGHDTEMVLIYFR